MEQGLDWYKREPLAYLGGVQGLTAKEHAVYSIIIDLIYLHGGPINNDPSWIGGWIKDMGPSSVRNTINSLILKEKLYEIDGQIMSKRAESEVKTKRNQSETNKKSGRLGGVSSGKSRRALSKNNDLGEANGSKKTKQRREEKRTVDNKEPLIAPQGGKRKSQWPNDFIPSKEHAEAYWLNRDRQDLNYNDEAQEFKDWCLSHGKKYLDWEAAWRTRYCNAVKFNKKPFVNNGFDKPKVISADEIEEMMNED